VHTHGVAGLADRRHPHIVKVLELFIPLRLSDDVRETGDLTVHDQETYPSTASSGKGTRQPCTFARITATAVPPTQPTSSQPTPSRYKKH
jgi:hypothetical protein